MLFVNFIVVTPYIKIISANFLEKKRAEAKFNLTASEFGHHFGDWMLFIKKNDPQSRVFGDVVLFNKSMHDEILIKADKAELINKKGVLQLRLDNAESYSYDNQLLRTMLFKTGYINDKLATDPMVYRNTLDYWTNNELRERKDQRFITNALLSLFPLLSIFLMIAVGIVHARHQKRWIYLWLFLSIVSFYAAAIIIQQWLGYHTIWVVTLIWLIVTYNFYQRLVGSRF